MPILLKLRICYFDIVSLGMYDQTNEDKVARNQLTSVKLSMKSVILSIKVRLSINSLYTNNKLKHHQIEK